MKTKRVVIAGGGISGLAAAHRLCELSRETGWPLEIIVLEASPRLGGVIETEIHDGLILEGGPDSFISDKPWALELCKRLGLESEIIPTQENFRRSLIYRNGKLHPVPEGFYLIAPTQAVSFVRSNLLSWKGKLRMGAEWFLPPAAGDADESVAGFVRRRFGGEALARIGQPMIGGIYTADLEKLSLKATFPKFREMEKKYGSVIRGLTARRKMDASEKAGGPRYSLFLSLRRGLGELVTALRNKMPEVELRCSTPLAGLFNLSGNRWVIETPNHNEETDAVCLAMPSYASAVLVKPVDEALAAELEKIEYESAATVNLVYRKKAVGHDLNAFGFIVPQIEGRKILACSFSSRKYAGRGDDERVLLRVFLGGALQREVLKLSDEDLIKLAAGELRQPLQLSGEPQYASLRRYRGAMPQYHVGHLSRVGSIEEKLSSHPGLYLTGNAYAGVGIPDCIHHAEETADAIFAYLTKRQETIDK